MMSTALSTTFLRELYAKMLLARIVDDCAWKLHEQGLIDFIASSHGYEAVQVGSSVCIEVGTDFTLPYYRDLGVVLTLGMTPYEIFRTYLQNHLSQATAKLNVEAPHHHWGYHKHNTVTGPAPIATQLLHAAGIAFASKLRKTAVVTVAYCDDQATQEPDFLEALTFAAQQQLPVVFICEQDHCASTTGTPPCLRNKPLPQGVIYHRIDGVDIVSVTITMRQAMQAAREGLGPTLLEMDVTRSISNVQMRQTDTNDVSTSLMIHTNHTDKHDDPLVRCQHYLQTQGAWDDEWAQQLSTRIKVDIENAVQDALRDTLQSRRESRAEGDDIFTPEKY